MTESVDGPEPIIIAIDGPAGVGKSSVAREIARRLGLSYLDTGAMYRAVALVASDRGILADDPVGLGQLMVELPIGLEPDDDGVTKILVNGLEVESRIRTPEIGLLASRFAAQPVIRRGLVELQQLFGRRFGTVLEGRDIGTVVFPETPFKFFLDARPEVRAARRLNQLELAGKPADHESILADIIERDRRDRERAESPLQADGSYRAIDTSDLSLHEVVEAVFQEVTRRLTV